MLFRKYKIDKFNMYISGNFMKNKVAIFLYNNYCITNKCKYVKINIGLKEGL